MLQTSSITDMPRIVGEKDAFGIEPFEKGLTDFIDTTSSPITIALQGEWGSGKTSLMNSLQDKLCQRTGSLFHGVWLNTWEYALMSDAQSTLLQIILKLIQEVTDIANVNKSQAHKLMGKAAQIGRGLARFGVKVAGDKVVDGVGDVVAEQLFTETGESTILEIRNELEDIIQKCIHEHGKKGFIFFIDDLDRIDPPVAVNLLELLKNIFTLKNCIFILAIDYDVVVKGLEPKFGKLSDTNEREFRSFFDKIIQVPFNMPVSNYQVADFLKDSLTKTGYISQEQANNDEILNAFADISNLTVGTNPRALKRLLNSLSLIGCINRAKQHVDESTEDAELTLVINYALVSIQIAYPPVYRLLSQFSAFDSWDESVALHANLPDLTQQDIEKLEQNQEFDEEWEQILYRYCESDPYLKQKSLQISKLLNLVKKIIKNADEDVENVIQSVVSLSSVTSIDNVETAEIKFHAGSLLKDIRNKLLAKLKADMQSHSEYIQPKGKRVEAFAYFNFSNVRACDGDDIWYRLSARTDSNNNNIKLQVEAESWLFPTYEKDFFDTLENSQVMSEYRQIESDYNVFIQKHPTLNVKKIDGYLRKLKKWHVPVLQASVSLESSEACTSDEIISAFSNLLQDWIPLVERLHIMSAKVKSHYDKEASAIS